MFKPFTSILSMSKQRNTHELMIFFVLVPLIITVLNGPATCVFASDAVPAPVSRLLYQVSRLYAHEDYVEAAKLIRNFCKRSGRYARNPDVLFAMGNCCLAMKKYRCAVENYKKDVAIRPEHSTAWQNMASALYNLQEYAEAADSFLKAFETREDMNPDLLYYSGVCWLMAGNANMSVKVLERLFHEFPDKVTLEWTEAMIRALIADHRNRRALPLLKELASRCTGEKKKQWSEVLLHQYLYLGMNENARKLALVLARNYPQEDRWWEAVVYASLKQGKLEEAIMGLTIISFIRPLNHKEARLLADMNLQADIPQKALPAYERLLADRPSRILLKYVVYACRELGRTDRALELLERYENITSRDFNLLLTRADIFYALSRYRDALNAYLQAVRLSESANPRSAKRIQGMNIGRAWLMAGYCAWQIDDTQTALHAFSRAAKFPSQKQKAVQARSFLEKNPGVS